LRFLWNSCPTADKSTATVNKQNFIILIFQSCGQHHGIVHFFVAKLHDLFIFSHPLYIYKYFYSILEIFFVVDLSPPTLKHGRLLRFLKWTIHNDAFGSRYSCVSLLEGLGVLIKWVPVLSCLTYGSTCLWQRVRQSWIGKKWVVKLFKGRLLFHWSEHFSLQLFYQLRCC